MKQTNKIQKPTGSGRKGLKLIFTKQKKIISGYIGNNYTWVGIISQISCIKLIFATEQAYTQWRQSQVQNMAVNNKYQKY